MALGKQGKTKKDKQKTADLIIWNKGEQWKNLTAYITDGSLPPCGQKGKKQKELELPSVCRPAKDFTTARHKTPKPLVKDIIKTPEKIKKAIKIKQKGDYIKWSEL